MRTELFLNNTRVDMMEEVQASLNLMIADIRDPKSRKGSFSKTIKLPASKTIDKLLGGIFDIAEDIQTTGIINFVPDFNPNLKCTAILYADGLEQFNGIMRLLSIDRDQQNFAKIIYNVILTGDVSNIYSAMSDKKLTELNLSQYNHTYDKATQQATWTSVNYGNGFVYPMINYGNNANSNVWHVADFYPATYLKTYIDAIFLDAGFTYTSTFFDSAFFKKLIVPFAGEGLTLSPLQVANRLFSAELTAPYITTLPFTNAYTQFLISPIIFNNEISDPSNQYNPTFGIFTALNTGFYEFYVNATVEGICSVAGTINAPVALIPCNVSIDLYHNYLGTLPLVSANFNLVNGTAYVIGSTIYSQLLTGTSQSIHMNAGESIYAKYTVTIISVQNFNYSSAPLVIQHKINAGADFENKITNTSIQQGETVDLSAVAPVDIKQADLFSSVMQTFNLFCEIDKTTPNNLIINTYDDFYDTGSKRDWTKKVDVSKTMTITPMGALDARRYQIKYSDDTDYWNKFYKDKWQDTYGEKNVDIVNDFLKNTNTNQVLFAPTPSIGEVATDRIIPEIYSLGNTGVQTKVKSKMRLLYWGGALATVNPWNYNSSQSSQPSTIESVYPYCGHVDNPITPTLDLCFGVPSEIYYVNPYGQTRYTNNNLYNKYHSKFIEEITDRNSKLIVLFVYLNPLDIFNISFRDLIYIDNHFYRLQKIIDYNPINPQSTKVELLKIKNGVPYVSQSKQIDFSVDTLFNNNDRTPLGGGNIGRGDLMNTGNNSVIGSDNYVSKTSSGSIVGGSNNRVGNNAKMVSILNSSGVAVLGGLSNVSVINTNDVTITESNVSYIDGVRMMGKNNVFTLTQNATIGSAGIYLCTGAITITMDTKFITTGDIIQIKRSAGGVVTISGGGITIDGAATFTLNTLYDSATLYYTGTEYLII